MSGESFKHSAAGRFAYDGIARTGAYRANARRSGVAQRGNPCICIPALMPLAVNQPLAISIAYLPLCVGQ